jgi:hypothetical protein
LRELESLLLRIIKTKGNKQKGKFYKSEDLRRKFTRDIKGSWVLEIQELLGTARARPVPAKPILVNNGRRPVLAEHIDGPFQLRARFKGKTLTAQVVRSGIVRYAGKQFTSPSLAAAAACNRSTCNGWTFWKYQRAPGDWVILDNLRK